MNDVIKYPSRTFQKWVKFFTHLLCLCIIFILPEVLMSRNAPDHGFALQMYAKSVTFVAVFYINYYFIIDRCLHKKYWFCRLVGYNLILLVAFMIINSLLFEYGPPRMHKNDAMQSELNRLTKTLAFMLRDVGLIVLTVALSLAMKLSDYWIKVTNQRNELEAARHFEELEHLKSQINPHFLFNTLNSIYTLIAINPDLAQKAVHQLSHLLRYALYETSDTVPLKKELDFVNNYIRLMRLRIGDRFPVNVTLDAGNFEDYPIAPLLFISPVENAFKYGNNGLPGAEINISIVADNGQIVCDISNTFDNSSHHDDESRGIGDSNLKRRLELIYGKDATLQTSVSGSIYKFRMTFLLNHKST